LVKDVDIQAIIHEGEESWNLKIYY
jgi:hypothetical protein